MESQIQQQEYTTTPEGMPASEPAGTLALPPAPQSNAQLKKLGAQVRAFLDELPEYIAKFYNENQKPITVVLLIVATIVTVKVVLAILDALNDIPLLAPTFELIGIGYSAWFVYRYLLKVETREELGQEIQAITSQVVGSKK
ncbi:CAAD domain-containing protein [Scytonema millei]|uniref:Cyanobacterial aminoacyl-tRNA synthetase CAAD domain-containing protein n=1 Tax=Scytonema millei VB511283 TaxID=1245923 RepID=A0A9X5I5B7_9CYAN|nr:CAAD domain-containing protein [Scytonema millei]NHC35836.1 hypothetical protein [Scytonema millei VB511283]